MRDSCALVNYRAVEISSSKSNCLIEVWWPNGLLGAGGGGGTPYNGLYGEAPPERGTFLRLPVYVSERGTFSAKNGI